MQSKISFIGAGNMANAIVVGLVESGHPAEDILATAPSDRHLADLQQQYGIKISHNNEDALTADVIFLAVKPQIMESVVRPLAGHIPSNALVVSLAAGITSETLQRWLTKDDKAPAIVRCMPNTPLQVGVGACGLFATHLVTDNQKQKVEDILSTAGKNFWLEEESQIDHLTAVSGSGPAYFFQFMEAMVNAAVKEGMDAQMALELTLQTALGAATLASKSGITPEQLKNNVMSPGGTTERAVHHFEQAGIHTMVAEAMTACRDRAFEMNKTFAD